MSRFLNMLRSWLMMTPIMAAQPPGTRRWGPSPGPGAGTGSRTRLLWLFCAGCSGSELRQLQRQPHPLGPVFAAPRPVSRSQSLPKLPS